MATYDPNKPALLQRRPPLGAVGTGLLGAMGGTGLNLLGISYLVGEARGDVPFGVNPRLKAQGTQDVMDAMADSSGYADAGPKGPHDSSRGYQASRATQPTAQPVPAPVGASQASVDAVGQIEPLRQQAKAGLEVAQARDKLPVKEIATALVDKQIEASGEKTSKEERQRKISQERKLISDLPADERTDYLSWALVAAGLVASAADESGEAGRAFAASSESALQRSHDAAVKKAEAAERKAAREEDREFRREGMDREEALLDKRFDQQDKQQQAQFDQQMLVLGEQQKMQREQMAQQASYQNAMLGLRQQQIEAKLAAAQGGQAPKLDLNQEDAVDIVSGVSQQFGAPLSKEVASAAAAQLRVDARLNPNLDPATFMQTWLKANAGKLQTEDPILGSPRVNFAPITK